MKALILTIILALSASFLVASLRLHITFQFVAICFVVFCLPFGLFSALLFSTPSNKEGVC